MPEKSTVPANGYRPGYKVIQVYLPQELKIRLSVKAAHKQVPYATMVRRAIEVYLDELDELDRTDDESEAKRENDD